MDATLHDPYVGRLLDGRYRVEARIARGGMATVYLGVDDRLDREVALKIMHDHLAEDPAFVSRFHREARAAARLSHPNVVQVFDQGTDGRALFLAMEYLPGQTLREALNRRGALTPRQSLSVLEPVLDALAAAHRSGIVHRDVKPENVILTDDGRVKVADFGLARAASAATSSSGVLLGTVAYLAPELVSRGIADARADVYAAGIVLFEMLTGHQPFTGEMPAQIAFRHVHEDVPAPSALVPWLPEDLDVLTRLATARDADSRPPDAGGMLGLVRGVHGRLPVEVLDRVPEVGPGTTPGPRGSFEPTQVVSAETLVGRDLALAADGREPPHDDEDLDAEDGAARRAVARRSPFTMPTPNRSWRWLLLLGIVFLLGLGLWWQNAGPGAYAEVPMVDDLPAAAAEARLAEQGFTVGNDTAYDDAVAKGAVVETRPAGGKDARKGSRVTLVVSRGPEYVVVPSVAKKKVDVATAALRKAGLSVGGTTERYSDQVGDGLVIGTDPKARARARVEEPVTLVVSKGPQPVRVPALVGRTRAQAERALAEARLKGKPRERFDDRVPAGRVITQKPRSGTLLPGASVSYVVSRGPELHPVPDVRDRPLEDARRILTEAGFAVNVQGTHLLNRVWQQSPGPGTQAPKGSTVVITTF